MPRPDHRSYIGKRVEIPVHYDLWMRGAKFGTVIGFHSGQKRCSNGLFLSQQGQSDYLSVKLDNPNVRKRLKVWRLDWEYMKVLE